MMRTIRLSILLLLSVFLTCSVKLCAEEPSRTWSNSTGRFTVDAVLLEFDGTIAKLKRADGKTISLHYDKLSKADQEYLDQRTEENPFLTKEEQTTKSPKRQPSPAKTATAKTPEAKDTLAFPQKAVNVKLDGAEEAGDFGDIHWKCKPDPAPVIEKKAFRRVVFGKPRTKTRLSVRNSDCFIDLNTGTKVLAASHVDATHSRDKNETSFTRVFLGNLVTGKATYFDSQNKLVPYGLSPQGDKAVFASSAWGAGNTGTQDVLHIARVDKGKLTPLASYRPFADYDDEGRQRYNSEIDIKWAAWADQNHVLVLSQGANTLVLLNTGSGKAVWRMKTSFLTKAFLSPSGRYCLVPQGTSNIILLETLTGQTVGHLDGVSLTMNTNSFGFSPDGTRLATFDKGKLVLWNATTGQREEPRTIPKISWGTSVEWLTNRFLLFHGKLIDVENNQLVWDYQGIGNDVIVRGETCWASFINYSDGIYLVPLKLPHPKAEQRIAKGIKDVPAVVQTGMDVTLRLDESVQNDRDEIAKFLEKKLEKNGLKIVENAPVTLVLKESEEKPIKTTYITQRGPFPRPLLFARGPQTEVESKPRKFSVSFLQKDEVLWERSYVTKPPSDIVPEELGETSIEDKVKEYMNNQTFFKWLETLYFPETIYADSGDESDMSFVSQDGIREITPKQASGIRLRESQIEAKLNSQ